jgi:hypothetical protein
MDSRPFWDVAVASSREERERVFRFRYECHLAESRRWPTSAFHDRRIVREPEDEGALLYFVESDGRLIGTLRLLPDRIPADLRPRLELHRFRRFPAPELALADQVVVSRPFRKTTALCDLLLQAAAECTLRGVQFLFSHVAPGQESCFHPIGFRDYAPPFAHPELGVRRPLVWPVGGAPAAAWLEAQAGIPLDDEAADDVPLGRRIP